MSGLRAPETRTIEKPRRFTVTPNLVDYEAARASFSWDAARAELSGLPGGRGLNIATTKELADVSGLDVIASGGMHTIDDVITARDANLSGVIIGRALYEGTIDLTDCLRQNG